MPRPLKLFTFLAGLLLASTAQAQTAPFAYGADVGWVTQQEKEGYVFRDAAGQPADMFQLLKATGIDSIRLRVWVDPKDGWNGMEDTLAKAKRAQALGQKIMIDFHYSDNWADPGKQFKPRAWEGHDVKTLAGDVAEHTARVLAYLKDNGIDVAWVQVGNEITNGLLWPDGQVGSDKADHFANLTAFTNAGYAAVKAVYPDAKVVIHIDNGWDGEKARWWFDSFFAAGGKADIIGFSYYPYWSKVKDWHLANPMLDATMKDMVARYNKPVMVVEIGYAWDQPAEAKAMMSDVIARVKALDNGMGQGVFYWEPDGFQAFSHYPLTALNDNGQFTEAMDAFRH